MSQNASSAAANAVDASVFQRLHPKAYLERFLEQGFRPDGRQTGDWRALSINTGSINTAEGSALVRLGDTTVVCGVKTEIAEPELDKPNDGFIIPNLDLPAICSAKFKPGAPAEEAQVLSNRLYDLLISCDILPLRSLCIQPGKAVWAIYIDVICINYDGNVYDAAVAAVVAALVNARVPKAMYNEETGKITCSSTEKAALNLLKKPLSMSFGIFDTQHLLCDPASFEDPLIDCTINVAVDESGGVCSWQHEGLLSLESSDAESIMQRCLFEAKKRNAEVRAVINTVN